MNISSKINAGFQSTFFLSFYYDVFNNCSDIEYIPSDPIPSLLTFICLGAYYSSTWTK